MSFDIKAKKGPRGWVPTKNSKSHPELYETASRFRLSRPSYGHINFDEPLYPRNFKCLKINETNFPDEEERTQYMIESKAFWAKRKLEVFLNFI